MKKLNILSSIFLGLLLMSCASSGPSNSSSAPQIDQGYGTIDAKKNTTAISQTEVGPNDNAAVTWVNLLQRTAGLIVTGHDNDLSIQIRGKKSMNSGNEPLFVLDGQILGNGFHNISFVDPAMIKRISVLKDAASASSYGSRGADGVILVTLKK